MADSRPALPQPFRRYLVPVAVLSSTTNGVQTQLNDCTGTTGQSWTYTPANN